MYDLHLSSKKISREAISALEGLGFVRDEFTNNTRCEASEYHATFRKKPWAADAATWEDVCNILRGDPEFTGCLEEERIDPENVCLISGGTEQFGPLPPLAISKVGEGKFKACDIHIGVNYSTSTPEAIACVDGLLVAYFDKPIAEGIRRVFTITCETVGDGKALFEFLSTRLNDVEGLEGKIKLELTTRHFRWPDDANVLPISTSDVVRDWLAKVA